MADFGLAQVITCSQALETKTMQSVTSCFQAPEQLTNEQVDEKVDVYTMGAVLKELFGEKPLPDHVSSGCRGCVSNTQHLPQPIQTFVECGHQQGQQSTFCDCPTSLV